MTSAKVTLVLVGVAGVCWLVTHFVRSPRGGPVSREPPTVVTPQQEASLSPRTHSPLPPDVGRVEQISTATSELEEPQPMENGVLEAAKEDLAAHINDSLDGFLYIDDVLDQVIAFANLPVDEQVDFDYEEDDAVAYRIQGTPEGTTAHLLVGLQPFERNGEDFRFFQMEVQIDASTQPGFYRDAVRDGPRISLTLDYDEDGQPGAFALLTERRVALRESRTSGIDAYQGRYTSGAGFRVDFDNTQNPLSETWGIINGNPASGEKFQGISPLQGDLEIDPSKIDALLKRFMSHLERIRRKEK